MIRRKFSQIGKIEEEPKGFDDYEFRLGDMMRGERATMGKTLEDVQTELRIKASYIAAIEDADPTAFDTPGFIAGYVRSYARYLNIDTEYAFKKFCDESGFTVAHGMSTEASVVKPVQFDAVDEDKAAGDIFKKPNTPFAPVGESFLSRVEPGAVGSIVVLLGLIGAIAFGGYTVLQEIQRVQVAPVEQTPAVMADLDPIQSSVIADLSDDQIQTSGMGGVASLDVMNRMYRPEALDVPILTPRDSLIASINPAENGNYTTPTLDTSASLAGLDPLGESAPTPKVNEEVVDNLKIVAAYPSWVRVSAADGSVIFESVMNKGDTWTVPATAEAPSLRTGESGAIYFAMADGCFGPVGTPGSVTSNVLLDQTKVAENFTPANVTESSTLGKMVADLKELNPQAALPCVSK